MMEDGYNSSFTPWWCSSTSWILNSSQERWAESSAVVTETGFCAEPGEVTAGIHSRIYPPGPGVQHTEYDFVTFPRQGLGNKGLGYWSGLLPHIQRCGEAARLNKFCQHGKITGKITFSPSTVLAKGELQDSRWSVQRAKTRHRGFSGLTLVAHLQATTKVYIQTLNREGSDNRCLQGGLWCPHEWPILQRQVACNEGQKKTTWISWS